MNYRSLLLIGAFASSVQALDDAALDRLISSHRSKYEAVYAAQRTLDTAEIFSYASTAEVQQIVKTLLNEKDVPQRIVKMLQSTNFALQDLSIALLIERPEWITDDVEANLAIFIAADSQPIISRRIVLLVIAMKNEYYRSMIVMFGMRSRSPQTGMAFGQLRKGGL